MLHVLPRLDSICTLITCCPVGDVMSCPVAYRGLKFTINHCCERFLLGSEAHVLIVRRGILSPDYSHSTRRKNSSITLP